MNLERRDDDVEYNLGHVVADYYFNPSLSVGVGYTLQQNEGPDDMDGQEIRIKKFFGQSISLFASYAVEHQKYADEPQQDLNVFKIGGAFRF